MDEGEGGEGLEAAENFKMANQKLIAFIKQGVPNDETALAEVDAWFDAHVELAKSDNRYELVFMPLYIEVLEVIRDHNPSFIRVLDQRFDEEDEFAIIGNMPEENDAEANDWDGKTKQVREEILSQIGK